MSQGHGHRSLSLTTVGRPSRKFCMKRAPMAVVVTRLTVRSKTGRPYSSHRLGRGICMVAGRECAPGGLFETGVPSRDSAICDNSGTLKHEMDPGSQGCAWVGGLALGGGTGSSTSSCIDGMKFFSGFKTNCFARRNADLGSGPWVATDSGFSWTDAEDTKSAQFNAISCCQREFQAFKNCVHGSFRFCPWQPCPLYDVVHYILLDQCPCPSIEENFCAFALRLARVPYWRDAIGSWLRCQS